MQVSGLCAAGKRNNLSSSSGSKQSETSRLIAVVLDFCLTTLHTNISRKELYTSRRNILREHFCL